MQFIYIELSAAITTSVLKVFFHDSVRIVKEPVA